ncbi:MAG: NAD(P)-dependent alcohol dehydrogenase [Gammaproteobacteria bacterium]|nr:NAD(P)-dependent alcohol dehydrogenase [Gammaproteobacteria bacterium]
MKAMIYHQYGSVAALHLEEVAQPVPDDNEVLIKVYAASVNDWDWGLLKGVPFANRVMAGLFKPKKIKILGCDIAGRIVATGKNIKHFKPGDEVFGDISACGFGGFAEYVCASEAALRLKPASMTFEQAAALPQASLLALQGLVDKGRIQSARKVLINGAGGGAGTYAIQIARSFRAEVTAVDSAEKSALMLFIGADHVIDYRAEDFTKSAQSYDLVLDCALQRSVFDCKSVLKPGGRYIVLGGSSLRILQFVLIGFLFSLFSDKKMSLLLLKQNKGLDSLIDFFEAVKVVPVIDKCYPLSELAEALQYFGEGHAKGKLVITIQADNNS